MKFIKLVAITVALFWSCASLAEGRIAVFDLDAAVLNTDVAKQRLTALRNQPDFKSNVKQLESLKKDYDKLVEKLQKDFDVLNAEQRLAQKNKIDSKRADAEHIGRKLEAANQQEAQAILQELGPTLKKILPEIVKEENIGLLLPRKAVMHADSSYDITAKVADKLNQAK